MKIERLKFSFVQLLTEQLKSYKFYYILGTLCLLVTHKIQSDLPFMAKEIADKVANNSDKLHPYLFFAYALGIIIFRTSSRILFFYPARLLQKFLRTELIEKIESSNPLRYRHINGGGLYQYLTGDIDQIRALIGFVGLQGANFFIGIFVLVPRLFHFNPKLILALIPMIVSFLIFTFVVNKNKKYFKLAQEAQGEVQNLIMETYIGKKTIKNFHAEESFKKMFSDFSLKELFYFYKSSLGISLTLPLITFGVGLSMIVGAYIIRSEQMGSSSLILFSGFIFLFMEPLGYLSWIGVVVARSNASWKRLVDLDLILNTEVDLEKRIKIINEGINSELKIPYWENEISISAKPGSWNILVGSTGSGKTECLFKISEALKSKNSNLSLLAQDPYIYNDTIEKNIFLGRVPVESEKQTAKMFLKLFGLDFLDSDLDRLLLLEVGENGKRLSGGQAKRLCLVRSLMSEAEYFLWDDPFSSVDLILEKDIFIELKKNEIIKNKTFILTGHRLSTVRQCDHIIYLDKNVGVVESGEMNSLLASKTKVYEYFEKQMV